MAATSAHLHQYLDSIEHLPAELKRTFATMRELDAQVEGAFYALINNNNNNIKRTEISWMTSINYTASVFFFFPIPFPPPPPRPSPPAILHVAEMDALNTECAEYLRNLKSMTPEDRVSKLKKIEVSLIFLFFLS